MQGGKPQGKKDVDNERGHSPAHHRHKCAGHCRPKAHERDANGRVTREARRKSVHIPCGPCGGTDKENMENSRRGDADQGKGSADDAPDQDDRIERVRVSIACRKPAGPSVGPQVGEAFG